MSRGAVLHALREHRRDLAVYARRVAPSLEDADDVLQAAAVRALERAASLRDPSRALPWLRRIIARCAADAGRARQRASRGGEAAAEEVAAEEVASPCACSLELLRALPGPYRVALERVALGDATLDAFAAEAGITKGNASVRLLRARRALRRNLAARCGVTSARRCSACSCATGERCADALPPNR